MTSPTPKETYTFDDTEAVTRALRRAVRDAIRKHKLLGNPIAVWENGKVVIIQPEDIVVPEVD
jgi:Arc/MetJ family transcription regulator